MDQIAITRNAVHAVDVTIVFAIVLGAVARGGFEFVILLVAKVVLATAGVGFVAGGESTTAQNDQSKRKE
jgi:hypothetical protein